MRSVEAFEAKNTLGALLDLVEQGEQVVITRHGKPIARLISDTSQQFDREAARQAAARIRERAKALKAGSFDWQEWKAYRDEGRRRASSSTAR